MEIVAGMPRNQITSIEEPHVVTAVRREAKKEIHYFKFRWHRWVSLLPRLCTLGPELTPVEIFRDPMQHFRTLGPEQKTKEK